MWQTVCGRRVFRDESRSLDLYSRKWNGYQRLCRQSHPANNPVRIMDKEELCAVARRALGFSMRVLYWTPRRNAEAEEREAGFSD